MPIFLRTLLGVPICFFKEFRSERGVLQARAEAPSVKLLPVPLYVLYTHLSMVCSETPACSAFSVSIEGSYEDAMAVAGNAVEVRLL